MTENNRGGRRKLGFKTMRGVIVVLGILTVLGRLGRLHWTLDWFALAHHYYFLFALIALGGFVIMRRWQWAAAAAVVVVINGWLLSPYLPTAPVVEGAPDGTIRLLVYNMYYANEDLEQMVQDIESYEADIVFIMEYSFQTQEAIESRFDHYDYRLIEPSRITMGLALFSHIPITEAQIHRRPETRIPIYEVAFAHEERPFTLVGAHPWPPIPQFWGVNHAQMQDVTTIAAEAPHPLIVAGDFNASPWAYSMRNLASAANVTDAHNGYWFRPTWQINPWLKFPLDHVLVSEEWQIVNYEHGDPGGSDHDFLILDLALREE